ncbi:hypothetical protein FQN52_005066 [Onygenales sp. PD_12]|nr:hypothetical protein FQN52_005066 [Onygenales sp. PD_12]
MREPIIVAVDVGLTCTGVAFCSARDSRIRNILSWPGTTLTYDKVPTTVAYVGTNTRVRYWGFECDNPPHGTATANHFKLYLDDRRLHDAFKNHIWSAPGTSQDIDRFYLDFLQKLYEHIRVNITNHFKLSDWRSTAIYFIFSVPTLWDEQSTGKKYKELVLRTGFGENCANHKVEFDLNEAEAAAVYTAFSSKYQHLQYVDGMTHPDDNINPSTLEMTQTPRLKKDNVILVVDSGGGTTDIATVEVRSILESQELKGEIAELRVLEFAEDGLPALQSRPVGSVQIDEAFKRLVQRRLSGLPKDVSSRIPKNIAAKLCAKFQPIKHAFGSESHRGKREYFFSIPELRQDDNHDSANIKNGGLVFTRDEIAELFDEQVEKIYRLMDAQLHQRKAVVTHIVLAGGLGSSHYVQHKILLHYGRHGLGIQVLISDKPQLAVCKGLAHDKLERLLHRQAIIKELVCKASYGIPFNEPVNRWWQSNRPRPIPVHGEPLDGRTFHRDRICWMVIRGQPVQRDQPIPKRFFRMVPSKVIDRALDDPERDYISWTDDIIRSGTPANRLPQWLNQGDAEKVANIHSKLSLRFFEEPISTAVSLRKHHSGALFRREEYWRVELELQIRPSSAGVHFEIWCDGSCISQEDENLLPVNWDFPAARHGEDPLDVEDGDGCREAGPGVGDVGL